LLKGDGFNIDSGILINLPDREIIKAAPSPIAPSPRKPSSAMSKFTVAFTITYFVPFQILHFIHRRKIFF